MNEYKAARDFFSMLAIKARDQIRDQIRDQRIEELEDTLKKAQVILNAKKHQNLFKGDVSKVDELLGEIDKILKGNSNE